MSRSPVQSASHRSGVEVRVSAESDQSVRNLDCVRSGGQLKAAASASVRLSDQSDQPVRTSDRDEAEALAAIIFSAALDGAGINRDEAAELIGVSRSLIDKMCEATGKSPSLIQIILLGPSFHVALIWELSNHFGLGRWMLARVQQSLGALALLVK